MKEPAPITPSQRLHIITETVALTITVDDGPPIHLEVSRLQREPHWLILPIDPKSPDITRTDDAKETDFAAFNIKIDTKTVTR